MLKNKTSLMVFTLICLGLLIWVALYLSQQSNAPSENTPDETGNPGIILGKSNSPNLDGSKNSRPEQYANVPASILSTSQQENSYTVKGMGVPGAGLMMRTGSKEIARTKVDSDGMWSLTFQEIAQENPQNTISQNIKSYDFVQSTPDGHQIRSDQTLIIVENALRIETSSPKKPSQEQPLPNIGASMTEKSLILLTAPGANSYVFQSPFGVLPQRDGFVLEAIDYDNSGGVIFSGTSRYAGEVYIYARGNSVGKSHVDNTGRWSLIFGSIMPLGEYDITAELIRTDGVKVRLTLPFSRKAVKTDANGDTPPVLSIEYLSDRLQIGRSLFGGGYQYTVVYDPFALEE